jgi:hypothetical protein
MSYGSRGGSTRRSLSWLSLLSESGAYHKPNTALNLMNYYHGRHHVLFFPLDERCVEICLGLSDVWPVYAVMGIGLAIVMPVLLQTKGYPTQLQSISISRVTLLFKEVRMQPCCRFTVFHRVLQRVAQAITSYWRMKISRTTFLS